jgi:lipoprotein-anchoring transpeptidase ErfK/SrfK
VNRGTRAVVVSLLALCALLGIATGLALAGGSSGADSTDTTTEPPTETAPPPPPAPPPPKSQLIEPGVIIGGMSVGWLTPRTAADLLRKEFSRPLVLVVSPQQRVRAKPQELGAQAKIDKAIRRARSARAGAQIPLDVQVSRAKLRRYVDKLARRFDREAVDAGVVLKGIRPRFMEAQDGRKLRTNRTGLVIRISLATQMRDPIPLDFNVTKPEVRKPVKGPAIVIMRNSNSLLLWGEKKLIRRFGVATGQSAYPTPTGDFEITNMQRDPWWYPPPSPWATESEPVPPGPGNPLGTRWMGISSPYVGIHGTPDAASIGYSASHGCIRMRISDAEWLFRHVKLGTPVFIIPR